MRSGPGAFLVGAAFTVLLALAFATVALGAITALRMPGSEEPAEPEPSHDNPTRRIPA
ncbi:hypothetical protein ACIRRH_25895 [Kitasatospora sp. NPDC101235]|uniref:hypothetical protein n=1 Tax=Kitasatospora sp. NPDC101235 TaxID=3364101 RepID=UPI003805A041